MKQIRIEDVVVEDRHRKDLGDLSSLQKSIECLGQLQPVVLDKNKCLIAGQRRLEAMKNIGMDSIDYVVAKDINTAIKHLEAERDENIERKSLTPSEAVSIGRALEKLEKPKAEERQRATQAKPGKQAGSLGEGKFPSPNNAGKTKDIVGKAIGMSGRTYHKARSVVVAAEENPEEFGDLADHMDFTGKVSGAYDELKSRKGQKRKKRKQPTDKKAASAAEYLADAYKNIGRAIDGIKAMDGKNGTKMFDGEDHVKRLKLARTVVSQIKAML